MQSHVLRARAFIVAIGLTVAALALVDAQDLVAGQATGPAYRGAAPDRSSRARDVEGEIASTNLGGALEAALGDAFGGVWFEPSTAQVHVGVTSPAGRRNAEAVAVQAGLNGNVTETPVRSSWAQLEVAQKRWNRRLADLFERAEVATSLSPERNSVEIELGSEAPDSRRAELEREASADNVNVGIVAAPYPNLGGRALARCNKFDKGLAFCDPTIAAGVTIDGTIFGDTRETCTAGPTARSIKRAKPRDATRTYLLTAGHCIKKGGGVGQKWYAYNQEGVGKGEKELGRAASYLYDNTDAGAIEVNIDYWAKQKDFIPVVPTIASWDPVAESDPIPVIKQKTPVKNSKSCMSGQMIGTSCGEIIKTDQSLNIDGVTINNLIEVKDVKVQNGDSGAPWFADDKFTEKTPTGYAEGILSAENAGTGNPVFQSLDTSFAELKKVKGLDLELLTTANEQRKHPVIHADEYPVTIHGLSTSGQKFTTEAGSIECKESTYHAVVSEEHSWTLTVKPEYKGCKASFFEASATISMEECVLVVEAAEKSSPDNYPGYADISCPEGHSIKLTAFTCKAEIKPQIELESLDLIDDTGASPKNDITARPTFTGIHYTVTQDGLVCPFKGTGEKTDGQYTSGENITLTGQRPSEPSVKIGIQVSDE